MLPWERIETGVIGEERAVEMAVAAVVGEEGRRAVLHWLKLQIDEGDLVLGVKGASCRGRTRSGLRRSGRDGGDLWRRTLKLEFWDQFVSREKEGWGGK